MLYAAVAAMTVAAGSLGAVATSASAASRATGRATAALRPERIGARPALPAGARTLGVLAPATTIQATVALQPPSPDALASYATAVATPGTATYRRYLTPAAFAARFAPSLAAVAAVRRVLAADGLSPAAVTADHLAIEVHGSAATFARAFSTSFVRVRVAGGRVAYANTAAPLLPASIARTVQGVIGLDDLELAHPEGLAAAAPPASPRTAAPHVVTGGPQACKAARSIGAANGAYTADQLASAYSYSSLYQAGDLGAGQTIAMYELEPNLPSDVAAYQSCYGTHTTVSYVKVDGGDGSGAGSGESILDIDVALGEAPAAKQLVYQGPNSGSGAYDTYNAIISQDKAATISTSWGTCELQTTSAAARAENTIFEEAAVQGQSLVDAAGDDGSEDCGTTALSADDPGGQPYVTVLGGLKLTKLGPAPTETVWNERAIKEGAGGGGISRFWPMPSYQTGAASSLHVINKDSSGTPCAAPSGSYCREEPDLAMDADPSTGYVVYHKGAWNIVGGTSAAAPLFASLLALTDASKACAGSDVGFVNPALYAIAGTSYKADFYDITTGNNDYTGTHGGLYPATAGYDMASGLGAPDGATLPASLCAGAATVTFDADTPPATAALGHAYRYQFVAHGSPEPTYSVASGALPAGLTLDPTTGLLAGTPTAAGTATFAVSAANAGNTVTTGTLTVVVSSVVAIIETTSGGHLVVSNTGDITASGGSPTYGSPVTQHLALMSDVVAAAAEPRGGYLLVTAGGNVLNFHAHWWGSPYASGIKLASPIVGVTAGVGGGYLLVTAAGTVYAYHTPSYGSLGLAAHLEINPVAGITADSAGGYWILTADGTVTAFHAANDGSPSSGGPLASPAVAITAIGSGYIVTTAAGKVYAYKTKLQGSPPQGGTKLPYPIVAAAPDGTPGYSLVSEAGTVYRYPLAVAG